MPFFRLRLRGDEGVFPNLLDVSTFLLDFTTLYEVLRLSVNNPEQGFTQWTLYRNRFRVPPSEKLFLESLRHESPLDLSAIFLAVGGGASTLWLLAQTFEKIWNMRLNRRKLAAEVEKAERENTRARQEMAVDAPSLEAIERRDLARVVPRLENRLQNSSVRIVDVEVETVFVEVPGPEEPPQRILSGSRGEGPR